MFDGWCIYDAVNDKYYDYGKHDLELLCNALNELDDNWIKELNLRETLQLDLQRVEEENKQLRQDIEYWKQVASQYSNQLNVFEHKHNEDKHIHWSSD